MSRSSVLLRFATGGVGARPHSAAARSLGVLLMISALLLILLPWLADAGMLFVAMTALTLGLAALALNLLLGGAGLVSFGQAMYFGFGAFTVAWLVDVPTFPPLVALALTPVIGIATAVVVGLVVLRSTELYFALLTLGVSQLLYAIVHGWYAFSLGDSGRHGLYQPDLLLQPEPLYWFTLALVAICALVLYVIARSPFGLTLRAIRENRLRAQYSGIWVRGYELAAYVVAGAFTTVAGGLFAVDQGQAYSGLLQWTQSGTLIIVTLIGGMNAFLGPVVGAFFYTFLGNYVSSRTTSWDVIVGVVVVLIAVFLPGGLSGALQTALFYIFQRRGATQPAGGRTGQGDPARVFTAIATVQDGAGESARRERVGRHGLPVVLRVEGASKSFGGLRAVDDVSFTVQQGTLHAIIGPNGAGKSTLFNLITGLVKLDGGRIFLRGENITGTAPWQLVKRGIGRSFQQSNLFWNLTTLENVAVPLAVARGSAWRPWGALAASDLKDGELILRRMGLHEQMDKIVSGLSHGDHRALEIAATLAVDFDGANRNPTVVESAPGAAQPAASEHHVRLLLLDEPTAGLSPHETKVAVKLIASIAREENLTIVFVEHDMEVVFGLADWVTVLHEGKILAEGTPEEIRRNRAVIAAYLGQEEGEVSVDTTSVN